MRVRSTEAAIQGRVFQSLLGPASAALALIQGIPEAWSNWTGRPNVSLITGGVASFLRDLGVNSGSASSMANGRKTRLTIWVSMRGPGWHETDLNAIVRELHNDESGTVYFFGKPKPAFNEPGAAEWRYERYVKNKQAAAEEPQSFSEWKKRHFDPAKAGGHQEDLVVRNRLTRGSCLKPRAFGMSRT